MFEFRLIDLMLRSIASIAFGIYSAYHMSSPTRPCWSRILTPHLLVTHHSLPIYAPFPTPLRLPPGSSPANLMGVLPSPDHNPGAGFGL